MAVETVIISVSTAGDGIAKAFGFTFLIYDQDDLTVSLVDVNGVETVQTIGTHYSVSGVGVAAGGTVTMVTAPPTGTTLKIERILPLLMLTDLLNQGLFSPAVHQIALDQLTMMIQQVAAASTSDALPEFTLAARPIASATWYKKSIISYDSPGPSYRLTCHKNKVPAQSGNAFSWQTDSNGEPF